MTTAIGAPRTKALEQYYGNVSLTREQATEIINAIWPNAPEVEQKKAIILCSTYQLNPLMKHVFLIPFGQGEKRTWAMVLGIQAQRLIAHRAGDFSYTDDTPRMMTEDEQKRILGKADPSKIWAITKLRDSKGNTAQGYGSYPAGETPYGADKGNTAANMAFIRSERNAFDRLFAGKMPQADVIDAEYIEVDSGRVNTQTGEITEAKPEVSAAPPTSEAVVAKEAVVEPPVVSRAEPKATEATDLPMLEFKNPGEFYTACLKHFGLKSKSVVDKEISMFDLAFPVQRKQAWETIVGLYGQKGT